MPANLLDRRVPWTLPQVLTTIAAFGIGALAVLVGWFGASGEGKPAQQAVWVSIAAAGLGVAGAGSALLLLNGRRAVGECRRVLLLGSDERTALVLGSVAGNDPIDHPVGQSVERSPRRSDRFVAGANMSKYHRPDCPLVHGKALDAATMGLHVAAGRRPCGVCRPSEVGS